MSMEAPMMESDPLSGAAPAPGVSVVICTRDRHDKIGGAVASVLANDHVAFDLTVVDQSRTADTREVVQPIAAVDKRLKYIHLSQAGLSRAYNAGIRQSTGPIIAFTDDDCIVPRDWIQRIEEAFNADPAGELLYGQVVAKPERSPGAVTPTLEFAQPERLSRRDGFRVVGMGANFAARRRLFDNIGGFDEVLGGGGPLRSSQDFDLAYRAFRAGSVILLRPEVTLMHDGLREADDWSAVLRNYGIGDGAFYSKHVRCGDMYALFLLLRRISEDVGRFVVKSLLLRHKRHNQYLTGLFAGIREGFKFKIDKSQRRYASS
jgi:glycosyltransferase involved in cell wall biosynthesis